MKNTALFSLFILSSLISHLPSATAASVLDTDGDDLRNGGTYFILPFTRGKGGGIKLAATGKETCPLTVVQSPNELSKGKPIIISSPARIAIITDAIPLNLSFSSVPTCATTPSEWTVVEGLPEGRAVKIVGYKNVVRGSFRIKKASVHVMNVYKLLFCARDGGTCGDLGIYYDDDGNRRLVVTENDTLLVKFQKVGSSSTV